MDRGFRSVCAVSFASLMACGLADPAQGDEPRLNRFEADARQLLDDVAKAYQAVPSIGADGELPVVSAREAKVQRETNPMSMRYARPDKVMLVNGPIRIVSDGKTLYTVVESLR